MLHARRFAPFPRPRSAAASCYSCATLVAYNDRNSITQEVSQLLAANFSMGATACAPQHLLCCRQRPSQPGRRMRGVPPGHRLRHQWRQDTGCLRRKLQGRLLGQPIPDLGLRSGVPPVPYRDDPRRPQWQRPQLDSGHLRRDLRLGRASGQLHGLLCFRHASARLGHARCLRGLPARLWRRRLLNVTARLQRRPLLVRAFPNLPACLPAAYSSPSHVSIALSCVVCIAPEWGSWAQLPSYSFLIGLC